MARLSQGQVALWRWVGIAVGGTILPFMILFLAYTLTAGNPPSLEEMLRRGELFIPAAIMNVEAIWNCTNVNLPGRAVWYPVVVGTCGLAALGGAVAFGITAALLTAPAGRIEISQEAIDELSQVVTWLSLGEFVEALVVGTMIVVLFMLYPSERPRP